MSYAEGNDRREEKGTKEDYRLDNRHATKIMTDYLENVQKEVLDVSREVEQTNILAGKDLFEKTAKIVLESKDLSLKEKIELLSVVQKKQDKRVARCSRYVKSFQNSRQSNSSRAVTATLFFGTLLVVATGACRLITAGLIASLRAPANYQLPQSTTPGEFTGAPGAGTA